MTLRLEEVVRRGQGEGVFRRDVDAHAILAAAVMIAMGCFTSREIMAAFVPVAFDTPEDMDRWRDLAVKVMLDQLLARP